MMGAIVKKVYLEKDFSLNVNLLEKLISKKTKIVWIGNPNNPTGNILLSKKQIENLLKKYNCLFIIDECYFEISKETAISLIRKYQNLIIIRSFSKTFSLAGLRLGYVATNESLIKYLKIVQGNNQVFSVNRLAQKAGIEVLKNTEKTGEFIKLKSNFEGLLKEISLEVIDTKTTFCLIRIPKKIFLKNFKEKLERRNIYIKDSSISKKCIQKVKVQYHMKAPIYVYYELDNYYQNHRRYIKSRSDKQLRYGLKYTDSSCSPIERSNGLPIVPCGLIAWSLFNDTYDFTRGSMGIMVDRKNISWRSDREHKYGKDVYPFNFQNGSLIGGGKLDPDIPLSNQEDL
ncbi:MAG: aminotransferase class I/II-fold pyridoxal phosphate-dependent enzyme, partial [Patescibacteria group bacterium]|nr:aminotransferase class I/II-fold pyridoxal phosphate-dependent enzyme [Patescibacteria group bacterium]